MPELPEVEAIRLRLAAEITGRKIREVEVLRASSVKPQSPATLARVATGKTIRSIERRGKNLLIGLSGGWTLRIHLRMTGNLRLSAGPDQPAATRVTFTLTGSRRLLFDDPRALGVVNVLTPGEAAAVLADLGPEPLSREFTPARLRDEASRSRLPLKLFLMDQRHVAGLGNVYAAEALFRARLNPRKPARRLRPDQVEVLHSAIVSVLREAVKSAKIAYTRPGRRAAGEFVPAVYGREGEACPVCGGKVRRFQQGGRSTYYCPACQR